MPPKLTVSPRLTIQVVQCDLGATARDRRDVHRQQRLLHKHDRVNERCVATTPRTPRTPMHAHAHSARVLCSRTHFYAAAAAHQSSARDPLSPHCSSHTAAPLRREAGANPVGTNPYHSCPGLLGASPYHSWDGSSAPISVVRPYSTCHNLMPSTPESRSLSVASAADSSGGAGYRVNRSSSTSGTSAGELTPARHSSGMPPASAPAPAAAAAGERLTLSTIQSGSCSAGLMSMPEDRTSCDDSGCDCSAGAPSLSHLLPIGSQSMRHAASSSSGMELLPPPGGVGGGEGGVSVRGGGGGGHAQHASRRANRASIWASARPDTNGRNSGADDREETPLRFQLPVTSALQDGQSVRLGEASAGHLGLGRLHLKA